MAKFIKLFCVTGLGILLLCLISCEQKQEPVIIKKQIMVVSKSIDRAENDPAKNSLPEKVVKQTASKIKLQPTKSVGEKSMPSAPAGPVATNEAKPEMVIAKEVLNEPVLKAKSYDTKGRVDPFIPLLSEKKEQAAQPDPKDNKPKRILTPLEKMTLSQIRLVAVIEMKGRFIAMVEEASGKGYEVKLGTYMGRNSGQVSAIDENGIVVKDYVRDFKGIRRERLQEIKFHKSEGEE